MKPARIDVHIGALVLHGFAAADRDLIRDAFEREVTRLLAERGVPASFAQAGISAQLDAGSIRVARGPGAAAVGAQIAQAIFRNDP
jgi:hypothetical protein